MKSNSLSIVQDMWTIVKYKQEMISQDEVKQLVDRPRHVESQMNISQSKSNSEEPRLLIK